MGRVFGGKGSGTLATIGMLKSFARRSRSAPMYLSLSDYVSIKYVGRFVMAEDH